MDNEQKKYEELYTKEQYERDEESFKRSEKTGNIDWMSFKRLMLHDLCVSGHFLNTGKIGEWSVEDVFKAMRHPWHSWRLLLAVSDELMRISPHYYRLNMLYSNMALFDWGIDIYGVRPNVDQDRLRERYINLANKLEDMHLKYEFSKIMKVLPYQDVFCGLIMENQNDFFIQQVSIRKCKLIHVQDGLYNFAINLSLLDPHYLDAYPSYVQEAWFKYREASNPDDVWYEPPADKQICLKLNTQWLYPFPMLIGILRDILDLDTYKKLKLQSARTDNYKAILVEVPIDEKQIDKPLLTPETLSIFAEINKDNMSPDIGLIHTLGAEGKAINFKDSSNTRNNVSDAVDEIYNSSGDTHELFNGSSSGTAVTFSIENDSGFIYGLYRQIEQWVNRLIKIRRYNTQQFKFHFYLVDITIFNRDKVIDRYKNAATLGATVVDKMMAALDMTPSRILGSYITHDLIYDFQHNFKPLSSTYNSSPTENEGGRPTNESLDEPLDEQGEITANNDSNMDR